MRFIQKEVLRASHAETLQNFFILKIHLVAINIKLVAMKMKLYTITANLSYRAEKLSRKLHDSFIFAKVAQIINNSSCKMQAKYDPSN
jgi:hypothetical protein